MSSAQPRRAFGLKNPARVAPAAATPGKVRPAKTPPLNPFIVGGAFAFIVAFAAVMIMGSGTSSRQGGPLITEVKPDGTAAQPAGGKFGAATDALQKPK